MKEQYEKLRLLGSGGMSQVWLVKCRNDGLRYAMKMVKQEKGNSEIYRRALDNEAFLLAGLHHPMIPKLITYESMDHFVMEYIDGVSLERYVDHNVSKHMLRQWMKEVIELLSYLHCHDIFYLDLKPQNLILDKGGHLHLIDFGASVRKGSSQVCAMTPRLRCA